jgi:glycosyltransferase involved in cell wall biosynthesis
MNPTFSLIIATHGRYQELADFLHSITLQTLDIADIEILIVDQNSELDLSPIVNNYSSQLNIRHVKSDRRGLSLNRNVGIAAAKGQIIAFPDDDCTYYPDTLESVLKIMKENPQIPLVLGKIIDRKTGKGIIRSWSNSPKKLTAFNFFTNYTSITIFTRHKLEFDEKLGAGTYFGSYEDADFVYRSIKTFGEALYTPEVEVWHPEQNLHIFSDEKLMKYGLGFGAFIRKDFSLAKLYIFVSILGFHTIALLRALIRQDKQEIHKRWLSISSRIQGFIQFSRKLS